MTWTLPGLATYESVIKNSVFRASAAPVEDEAAAMAFFREVAVLDATHNCWAFKIGQRFRCSDDGEPGGTAGRPILSAIEGQDFDNVMIVVTRWYGGVQLGAGGLVRAYGGAASACLREADRIERIETAKLRFHCPFSSFAMVESKIESWRAARLECDFDGEGAWITLAVPVEEVDAITDWLRDLTRGQMDITQPD
ncbi:YigZ family protein [Gluconobacter sphaericus]|uniref:IMPACT family protein n=1 Tax=Gluconobacter sphaericus TaxID=574987 RepID=UPI00192409C5|nr:YigZ family protein [Gluconobacter sphaericus]QQX91945.1 YigZ family protein [Gluconobacter sphaericus]